MKASHIPSLIARTLPACDRGGGSAIVISGNQIPQHTYFNIATI